MNVGGGEAADQVMRMMLSGGEMTVRLGASAIKNLAAISIALARNHKTLSGKIAMKKMLQQTRDLRLFPMTPAEFEVFRREAKEIAETNLSVCRQCENDLMDLCSPLCYTE